MDDKLAIIMPVYNEETVIGSVLDKWANTLDALGIKYQLHPYNDGSRDGSLAQMEAAAKRHPGRIVPHNKPNGGHGPTILQGYREAADNGFDWIFQIDSDDEMGPESFGTLWVRRAEYDFLAGYRDGRLQPLPRKIISVVSRMTVKLFYGKSIWDVNTPYRLMRAMAFAQIYHVIPDNTFAPNVIISGLVARKHLRFFEMPVPQHNRLSGEVSIKKWKLLKAAMKSFWQTICFSWKQSQP